MIRKVYSSVSLRGSVDVLPMAFGEFDDAHQPATLLGLDLPSFAAPDSEQSSGVGTKDGLGNVGPPVQFEDTPTA